MNDRFDRFLDVLESDQRDLRLSVDTRFEEVGERLDRLEQEQGPAA